MSMKELATRIAACNRGGLRNQTQVSSKTPTERRSQPHVVDTYTLLYQSHRYIVGIIISESVATFNEQTVWIPSTVSNLYEYLTEFKRTRFIKTNQYRVIIILCKSVSTPMTAPQSPKGVHCTQYIVYKYLIGNRYDNNSGRARETASHNVLWTEKRI